MSCAVVDDRWGLTGPLCAIAIVELDEGPWVYAWVEGMPAGRGDRFRVRLSHDGPGTDYPHFVAAAG